LMFAVINAVTYVAVVALLLHLYWPLGLLVAVSAIPLFILSQRFTSRHNAAARLMQDPQGDLATQVEETAGGIRVIKAFGRRAHLAGQFREYAQRVHDTAVSKTNLVAGAVAVANGAMTIGELVAFVSLQLMLIWPIDALGYIIANGQEAMTAADRIYEVLDTAPSIVDDPGAVPLSRSEVRGALRFE